MPPAFFRRPGALALRLLESAPRRSDFHPISPTTAFFYDLVQSAEAQPAGLPSALGELDRLAQATFTSSLSMTDYLYIQASQKEPFRLLDLTPAVVSIVNLVDGSYLLIPEVQYSPASNLALRFRTAFLVSGAGTEFGEKRNDYRIELRIRFFF